MQHPCVHYVMFSTVLMLVCEWFVVWCVVYGVFTIPGLCLRSQQRSP